MYDYSTLIVLSSIIKNTGIFFDLASRHLLFFGFFGVLRSKWTRLVKNEKKFPRENAAAMLALKK
jgi:hypothetical protein